MISRALFHSLILIFCCLDAFIGVSAAPANDFFTNRFTLATPIDHYDSNVYGATNEVGEPLPDPSKRQTLWWRVSPTYDGIMAITVQAGWFPPTLAVYEGSTLESLTPISDLADAYYKLQAGHEYAFQVSGNYGPNGDFTFDSHYYYFTNDMFANSERLQGTNVTYQGVFVGATSEPGEPPSGGTNTVWASWTAPFSGKVSYSMPAAYQFQYLNVFTGSTVDNLQSVSVTALGNRVYSFIGIEGTTYYFQFSGGADSFTFNLSASPLGPCTNDNFADAPVLDFSPHSVMGATMELGEPAHLGPVPQKSLWWNWRAPQHGNFYITAGASLVPNVLVAVYQGNTVDTLTLVSKATNTLSVPVTAGDTYHIAGAVPADAVGDIAFFFQVSASTVSHPVPGNLLQEWSWEGTAILNALYWHWTGGMGGYVNESGGADGTTWPTVGSGTTLWQDFSTVPGHQHRIRFAYRIGPAGCCGDAHVRASWNSTILGVSDVPAAEAGFWHWTDYTMSANNSTSRITFEILGPNLDMDAFSVIDLTAPPTIVTQPASLSTLAGGTAAFVVGATGTSPLAYQWHFNGSPLSGATSHQLVLDNVVTIQSGDYWAVVTNAFGAVTSATATLVIDAPTYPTIVWQPYGDTVPIGGYFGFSVAAVGAMPLDFQWTFNGSSIIDATNKTLVFTNVQPVNAGVYAVRVHNSAGTVWSLPATLSVSATGPGGGMLIFQNRFSSGTNVDAPIYDIDGSTRLSGSNFLAQLYAGPSLALLRPVGQPSVFRTGPAAGYVVSKTITLANVPPGANATAQIRAWDPLKGSSYEEARALAGKFGKSDILNVQVGGDIYPPAFLLGLQSFSLQAGLPRFASGSVQFVGRGDGDTLIWSVTGEAGYRYLVEKSFADFVWQPFVVVTNVTGTVTFTDSATNETAVTYYRSRILD